MYYSQINLIATKRAKTFYIDRYVNKYLWTTFDQRKILTYFRHLITKL